MTTAASWPERLVAGRTVARLYGAVAVWGWSLAAMAVSSVTSFTLSLLAGRELGASGLGVVFAGFTAYVMLLTFHRALVTTPLISTSSSMREEDRRRATSTALAITLVTGAACGVGMAMVGVAVAGEIGKGLLLFSPWLLPAFAQDLFRSSLVRDRRARRAALSDLCWFCTLVLVAVAAIQLHTVWSVVASWGLGSAVAATIGFVSTRPSWVSAGAAWEWFRHTAFPFGRWLAIQEGVFVLGFFGLYMALAGILGVDDLGGLRAAESVFAPFTLLAPALTLAGLPALSRAYTRSHGTAAKLAGLVSGLGVALTLTYAGVMLLIGPWVLTTLFGPEFDPYTSLIVPMSCGQVALAAGLGFAMLLKAEQRGSAIALDGIVFVATSLALGIYLGFRADIDGAVWGLSAGAAIGSIVAVCLGLRPPRWVAP